MELNVVYDPKTDSFYEWETGKEDKVHYGFYHGRLKDLSEMFGVSIKQWDWHDEEIQDIVLNMRLKYISEMDIF